MLSWRTYHVCRSVKVVKWVKLGVWNSWKSGAGECAQNQQNIEQITHTHRKKLKVEKKQTKKNLSIECDNQFSHSLFRKHKEKTQ